MVVRVGEYDASLPSSPSSSSSSPSGRREGVRTPRGVQLPDVEGGVAVLLVWSLDGDVRGVCCCFGWGVLVGDVEVGVVARFAGEGEDGVDGRWNGEEGDSGRLKGEVRGEP